MQLSDQIAAEKDTREVWISRYEKEQKAHIVTHTDLLKLKGQLNEIEMAYESSKTTIQSLEGTKQNLSTENTGLQKKLTDLIAQNEKLSREVFTGKQLMKSQDDANERFVQHVRNDFSSIERKFIENRERLQMEYEELRETAVQYSA